MDNKDKFHESLEFLRWEATTLWTIFSAYLVANSIFMAVVGSTLNHDKPNPILLLLLGIIGFVISLAWYGSYKRNSSWYSFRMMQAKRDEKNLNDTSNWYLLNGDAEKFANEDTVDKPFNERDGEPITKIKGWKNNDAADLLIAVFLFSYFLLIMYSLFSMFMGSSCCCR